MTEQEIIKLAAQCGFVPATGGLLEDSLFKFTALVEAREREACCKICDEVQEMYGRYTFTATSVKEIIQARGI